jgi:hypothetical protein
VILRISYLQRKLNDSVKKLSKNLVSSQKSSTFAADFAINASERLNDANDTKNCKTENQLLTKKVKKFCKKVA